MTRQRKVTGGNLPPVSSAVSHTRSGTGWGSWPPPPARSEHARLRKPSASSGSAALTRGCRSSAAAAWTCSHANTKHTNFKLVFFMPIGLHSFEGVIYVFLFFTAAHIRTPTPAQCLGTLMHKRCNKDKASCTWYMEAKICIKDTVEDFKNSYEEALAMSSVMKHWLLVAVGIQVKYSSERQVMHFECYKTILALMNWNFFVRFPVWAHGSRGNMQ